MKGKKVCKRCKKIITIEQKAVMLMTFIGERNLEKVYWHWQCYLDWVNESIKNKANKVIAESMGKAMKMAQPMIEKLKNLQGGVTN